MDPRKSRGFLNNNPGNIDRGAELWQGEIRDPADPRLTDFQRGELTKGRFCVFVSPLMGIRAMARNLFAYTDRAGLCEIADLINRWAPPIENNTSAYVDAVAKRLGVPANTCVNLRDYKVLHAIVDAIIRHECGGMPYAGSEIEDGLRLAGVVKPVGVTTSKTATSLTVSSGATIAGVGVEVAQDSMHPATDVQATVTAVQEPLRQTAEGLAPFAGTSPAIAQALFWLKIVLAVIAIVGIAVAAWERVKRARRDREQAAAQAAVGALVGQ
ncbi:MAG: hypothetical protein Q8M19_17165 [Reyranella sp.]|nr:hypothetical protein [Reyranella sp.]